MKNLLNCHVIGMHSFPITKSEDLYERIFVTGKNHELHPRDTFNLAIHPHHVNIKITVLKGELTNVIYRLDDEGELELGEYEFKSVINNGQGGFTKIGNKRLTKISENTYHPGESFSMESCDMHTVFVPEGMESAWLVQEDIPSCDYFPVSYSDQDLTKWDQSLLYRPAEDVEVLWWLWGIDYEKYLRNEVN